MEAQRAELKSRAAGRDHRPSRGLQWRFKNYFDDLESFSGLESFRKGQEFCGFLLIDFYPYCTEIGRCWPVIVVFIQSIHWPYLLFLQDKFAPVAAQRRKSMTEGTRRLRGGP